MEKIFERKREIPERSLRFFSGIRTDEAVVALTFDDGPNEPYTSALLDILGRFGVRATFFVVGRNVERFPEIARRIVADGHDIGNHSYHHRLTTYLTNPSYGREIDIAQDAIARVCGVRPTFFRSPWLVRTPLLGRSLRRRGLVQVGGTFASRFEIFQRSARKVAEDALRRVKRGGVLIFHDGYNDRGADRHVTVSAVEIFLREIAGQGYRCATVSELMRMA